MDLKIIGLQVTIRPGEPEHNLKTLLAAVAEHGPHFEVLVFPEMAIPGYLIGDAWERPGFLARCSRAHEALRQASLGTCIIFGSVGVDDAQRGEDGRVRLYNAAHVFQNGRIVEAAHLGLPFWPKTLLANYREFEDARHFYDLRRLAQDQGRSLAACIQPAVIQGPDGAPFALGITICEDAWCDDYTTHPISLLGRYGSQAAQRGLPPLKLVVNLSASPFTKGKASKRHRVFAQRAADAKVPVLYVNTLGVQNNGKNVFIFDGRSALYAEGQISECAPFQDAALPLRIPSDSQPGSAAILLETSAHVTTWTPPDVPFAGSPSVFGDSIENTAAALLYGLRSTCAQWGIRNVTIGASGGIDSAVVSALMCLALGPDAVTLVTMPSRHNSELTQTAAETLARNLGTPFHRFGIEESVRSTLEQLFAQPPFRGRDSSAVAENIQARDRGSRILAALSAAMGGVFSCNSNKTEMTIGYCTLYGDAAGFLAPIGDLWKTEVYALARYLNGLRLAGDTTPLLFEGAVIPEATLNVTPSAELSPQQDVTQGLGDPLVYPYHDALFRLWVENWNRWDLENTLEAYDSGELEASLGPWGGSIHDLFAHREDFVTDCTRWWNLYRGMAAFKRVQLPPLLTLSRRAFGYDHRESVG